MKNVKTRSAVGISPAATPVVSKLKSTGERLKKWVHTHHKNLELVADGAEWLLFGHLLYERFSEGVFVPGWETLMWVGALILSLTLDFLGSQKVASDTWLRCLWTFLGWLYFMITVATAPPESTTMFLILWKFFFFIVGESTERVAKGIFKRFRKSS